MPPQSNHSVRRVDLYLAHGCRQEKGTSLDGYSSSGGKRWSSIKWGARIRVLRMGRPKPSKPCEELRKSYNKDSLDAANQIVRL